LAGAQIDDAETAVSDRGVRIDVKARFVGSPMRQDVAHLDCPRRGAGVQTISRNDSGDPAHD
jgi:hypothetical protein